MPLPRIGVTAVVDNSDGYLKAIKQIEAANESAVSSVKDTAKGFDVLNDSTDYARDVQNRYTDALGRARAGLEDTAPQVDHFKEAMGAAAVAVSAAEAVFSGIVTVLSAVGKVLGAVIDKIVDLGKHIFDSGVEFGKIMTNISAVTKKTGADLNNLSKELIDIGSTAVDGPMAVADAYYDVASGISDASIAMDVLKDAVYTAEAGQADLKATTNGLISVINSYKGGITEAAYFSDVFTQTVNVGKGTMNEFVAALSPLASLAASQKVAFDELGGAMAFMTQKGLTAGQAGTALQGIMTQLSRKTPGVTKALRAMGEQSVESSIANHGLAGTLKLLTEGASKTGQNLQTLVGRVEAMKAVTILGTDEFKSYFKTFMDGVDEATSKAREIQRLDVGAQLQLINARFEGIGLSISQAVLPALGKFLKFITDSMSKFDWKKIGQGLDKVGEALGKSVGDLATKLGDMLMQVNWDKVATSVQEIFGSIADAIAGIDWNAVIAGVQGFVQGIQTGITSIGQFFTGISEFATGVQSAWNGLVNFMDVVGHGMMDILAAGIEEGRSVVEGAVKFAVDGIEDIWNSLFGPEGSISTTVSQVWLSVQTAIQLGAANVQIGLQAIVDGVTGIWNGLFGPTGLISTAVSNAFANVQMILLGAQILVTTAVQGLLDGVMTIWNGVFGEGGSLSAPIKGAFDLVISLVEQARSGVETAFNAIATAIMGALGPAIALIGQIASEIQKIAAAIGNLPGGGGGGSTPGVTTPYFPHAAGGRLDEGLNLVGEKGAELIWKAGASATVFTARETNNMLAGGMGIAQSMAMPVAGGDTYNTTNNNMMNLNFNGVQNAEGAVGRFALMKATGRY